MPRPTRDIDLVITRLSEVHLEAVNALYQEPAVCRQVLQMPYQSVEVWRKRLEMSSERRLPLVAVHEGQVVGAITLEQSSRIRQSHVGSIGMGVGSSWHGRGIGTRLMQAALAVADDWMNLRRVELTVFADNAAAIALYRKFDFEVEGQLRDYAIRDGAYTDALTMARVRR
ncbi:GNAT family N-acetyltransferase [Pseudomonas cremoricolorata]|uniref:GNAT family N-acetyltransferase n=1 Tax=Pseudomonas cremoricolorata TaxID=157783 RepID=UPI000400403B|nr:GNAT family N-acetyltransferase [Pseudomonas cremoricolorata]